MRQFGLVGYPLGHSFSKDYFDDKFSREGLVDCQYDNYEIENLTHLPEGLDGINVTIPHKERVIPLLKSLDATALEIGAVNCIDANLKGYNTDVIGFERSLLSLIGHEHPDALIFGSGGASCAVQFALKRLGIKHTVVSRGGVKGMAYDELTPELVADNKLLINTTPLGMYPNTNSAPEIPYHAIGSAHFLLDLIYNPAETLFLRNGRLRGAWVKSGIEMLRIQAEAAWEIWNRV